MAPIITRHLLRLSAIHGNTKIVAVTLTISSSSVERYGSGNIAD
jgi:hypothetical protein